jgi:long-chain acyl-CoA synthetase
MALRTLNEMLLSSRDKFRDRTAFKVKEAGQFKTISYRDFYEMVTQFGSGLLELGLKKGDHIGLISENRLEWIVCDMAIIGIGAVDVPASENSYSQDIAFKLQHSDSIAAVLEGEKVLTEFIKVSSELPNIKNIILLDKVEIFSEPDEAPEWVKSTPFQVNGKINKSFYRKICSALSSDSSFLFISEKAKIFLDKYWAEHGKELSINLKLTGDMGLEERLGNKLHIVRKGNIENLPPIYSFSQLEKIGKETLLKGDQRFFNISRQALPDDLITIIYTSGTTSDPKGVMLTHRNIMHNVLNVPLTIGDFNENDRFLSVLPSWHIYERTVEYCAMGIGASTAYSKPFKQILLPDLLLEKPTIMCTVPRIWQSLHKGILQKIKMGGKLQQLLFFGGLDIAKRYKYAKRMLEGTLPLFDRAQFSEQEKLKARNTVRNLSLLYKVSDRLVFKKIRDMLGGEIKFAISGGGALPEDIDIFLDAVDVLVLEGYGLTETSPVVAGRKQLNPIIFTVGEPILETYIKIVDKEIVDFEVPDGLPGIIFVKGDMVMKGYYKNEERTAEVMKDGWFNTGDLGKKTYNGKYLKIIGRIKDTIVLAGGENVEPQPLEDKLKESPYINMAIVVGQDKSRLGALIVPDFETLKEYAQEKHLNYQNDKDLIKNRKILSLFQQEQKRLISKENGFQPFEVFMGIALLADEFSLEKGEMTESLKLKRFIIHEKYQEEIDRICAK